MLLSGIIAALTSLLLPIIILLLLLPNACYVVEQQHAVIIERLGKFNRIVNAGFHMKVPVIDRKAATVSLRTMKNGFGIDVKTQDNVTIGLEVSAQYHVSYDMGAGPADSGIYKSYYMLQEPVDQMRDFITDALRSSIPVYTLDEVFAKKDDIAKDVNATVSEQMAAYGFTLVPTLITKIALPTEVENSMNDINAAQRKRAAAQELAEADRIKRVTEATAEAEAMEKAGEGIANQRKAIALGIKDSLEIIQETGVGNDEANQLFMFTQWSEMMTEFARTGKTSTVVLPSDFSQSASMFEQMLTARTRTRSAPRMWMRTTCCARWVCLSPVACCTALARIAPRWSALWVWAAISPMAARPPSSATMMCARHSRRPRSIEFCSRRIARIWLRSPFAVLSVSRQ